MKKKFCKDHQLEYENGCCIHCAMNDILKSDFIKLNDCKITSTSLGITSDKLEKHLNNIHKRFSVIDFQTSCKINFNLKKEQTQN